MSLDPSAETLNECFASAMAQRCRHIDSGIVARLPGIAVAFTGLSIPTSFCTLTSRPASVDDFAGRLSVAIQRGEATGQPWTMALLEPWITEPGYDQTLIEHRLTRRGTILGMSASRLSSPRRKQPSIDWTIVRDDDALRTFAKINNGAYGYDPSLTTLYEHYRRAPGSYAVVGSVDDTPVACAAACPLIHGTYLGGVATVEAFRGRGYGEAVSRQAIEVAMAGGSSPPAILFASPKRAPFYEPLGFTVGATIGVYRLTR
jgi:GNAT superfamily N-acetyltransferase